MGRPPIQGKMSRSKRRMMRPPWLAAHVAEYLANHSRATTSKLFAARSARADFCALRFSLGSMPSASSLRAASRRSRASFKARRAAVCLITEDDKRLIREIEEYEVELHAMQPDKLQALYEEERAKERMEQQAKADREEAQRFFNQPGTEADFAHWSKAAHW